MTARDEILAAAREHGWKIVEGAVGFLEMTKAADRKVYVEFKVKGSITYAYSDRFRPIEGPGKKERVIEELARE